MSASALIKRFLLNFPCDKMFTTRAVLSYGSRSAIDQALSTLVKYGVLKRIVRGVFVKAGTTKVFSNEEVATIKAESFGRKILPHPTAFNIDKRTRTSEDPARNIYGISGYSSSFRYGRTRIFLRALVSRKSTLQATEIGAELNHLWSQGEFGIREEDVGTLFRNWDATKRLQVAALCGLIPSWLVDHFLDWFTPSVINEVRQRKLVPAPG